MEVPQGVEDLLPVPHGRLELGGGLAPRALLLVELENHFASDGGRYGGARTAETEPKDDLPVHARPSLLAILWERSPFELDERLVDEDDSYLAGETNFGRVDQGPPGGKASMVVLRGLLHGLEGPEVSGQVEVHEEPQEAVHPVEFQVALKVKSDRHFGFRLDGTEC